METEEEKPNILPSSVKYAYHLDLKRNLLHVHPDQWKRVWDGLLEPSWQKATQRISYLTGIDVKCGSYDAESEIATFSF